MRAGLVLLGSLILFVGNATAANWVHVIHTEIAEILIDTESVVEWDGKVKAWFLYEYGDPQTAANGKKYLSSKVFAYFDCTEQTVLPVQALRYEEQSGTGDIVSSSTTFIARARFEKVTPDTVSEPMLMFACSLAGHGQ